MMVATTLAPPRPSPTDTAIGDLVLRIHSAVREGQIVRLKSAKCTVGSGPRCTLRLRARGVSPVHCLILRGQSATIVRRWSPDTRLNQQAFTDAPLSPGDWLSIGPIELEVVSLGVDPTIDRRPPEADLQATVEQQRLEEERHRLAETTADLQHREASLAERLEDLNARLAEVENERRALDQQRQQWQAEQSEAQRRLDEQRDELAARQTDSEARQNALAEERRQWEAGRSENLSQATAQTEQLTARLAEVENERRALDQQRQQWQAEQSEAQRRLDEQRDELTAHQTDSEARQNALAEERRQWERQRAESAKMAEQRAVPPEPVAEQEQPPERAQPTLQFESPPEEAPVNLADILRRVGADIEPEESRKHTTGVPSAEVERPRDDAQGKTAAAAPTPAGTEEEEESIEEYMSRLMERIRSAEGRAEPTSSTPPSEPARAAGAAIAAAEEKPQPALAGLPAAARHELTSLSPRTTAPEKRDDLSALRALANLSARSAISRYARQTLLSSMHSKLIVAVVAMAAGGALLWMWEASLALEIAYYSALVSLIIALYFGVEYALLTGRLRLNKSGHIEVGKSGLLGRKSTAQSADSRDAAARDSKAGQISTAGGVGNDRADLPSAGASVNDD